MNKQACGHVTRMAHRGCGKCFACCDCKQPKSEVREATPATTKEPPEPYNEVSHTLGKYLNTMVADLRIEDRGQYLRDLFSKYETEARSELTSLRDERDQLKQDLVDAVAEIKDLKTGGMSWEDATCGE